MVSNHWVDICGQGSKHSHMENLSLAAELFVTHTQIDEESSIEAVDGILLNRHVWRERQLKHPTPLGPAASGEDQDPLGAHISLAAQERGADGLGGELLDHFAGTKHEHKSAHEKEWLFLQEHVEQAYAFYRTSLTSWPQIDLTDWQKVEALARYATRWKMRTADVYASFHPVDVLFHSSYCTGAANILQALAMVAGFKTRFIAISNHSTIEIHVNGRWIWADNIITNGGVTPNTFNYADLTSDPDAYPSLASHQNELYKPPTARYRSPYSLSAQYYWHFMSGASKGRGTRDDINDGYGLSLPYDPSTAAALYPELKQHRFLCPKTWGPTICLCEKGSLTRAAITLQAGQQIRKQFYIGQSDDNPITAGMVKLFIADVCAPESVSATINGKALVNHGLNKRRQANCIDFSIESADLSPGVHEIVFTAQTTISCYCYPDPIHPYLPPLQSTDSKEHIIDDTAFSIDPCVPPAELDHLVETLIHAPIASPACS